MVAAAADDSPLFAVVPASASPEIALSDPPSASMSLEVVAASVAEDLATTLHLAATGPAVSARVPHLETTMSAPTPVAVVVESGCLALAMPASPASAVVNVDEPTTICDERSSLADTILAPEIPSGVAVESVTRVERSVLAPGADLVGDVHADVPTSTPATTGEGSPDEPTTDLSAATMLRVLPDNLIVYSRMPRARVPPPDAATDYIGRVTRKVDAIVQVPVVRKRREKMAGPVSMPRRSCRIAKLPPEFDKASTTTVCRKLGLADDDGKISDEALNWYSTFYRDLLGRDHVEALSALFGWAAPSEENIRRDPALVSVY